MSDTSNRYLKAKRVSPAKYTKYYSSNPLRDTQGIKGRVPDVGNVKAPITRNRVTAYVRKYGGSPLEFGLKKPASEALEQGAMPLLKTFAKAYGAGLVSSAVFLIDGEPLETFGYVTGGKVGNDANGLPQFPKDGFWVKEDGDHIYGFPYTPTTAANLFVSQQAYYPDNGAISGQAIAIDGLAQTASTAHYGNTAGFWWGQYDGFPRYGQFKNFRKVASAALSESHAGKSLVPQISSPSINPNIQRARQAEPLKPARDPIQRLREQQALYRENMENNPSGDWIAREYIFNAPSPLPTGSLSPPIGRPSTAPVLPPPLQPIGKTPPSPNEAHAKAMSRAAQIGVQLFKRLDQISESAEVVDAIYMALPLDVRKAAEKGRDKNRGFVDQAGQYGIDGADWKLQVLAQNWHQVDAAQAVKNILANEIEDRLYGKAYQAKDKVTARGRYRGKGKSRQAYYTRRQSGEQKRNNYYEKVSKGQ